MYANHVINFFQSSIYNVYNYHLSISFLIPFFLFLSIRYLARQKHTITNLPPSPGLSVPLIGHLYLLRSSLHISLRHLSQKYGKIICLNFGQFPTIVASSPEIAAKMLKSYDTHFCTRPSLSATSQYSYGGLDVAFSAYNQHWMQLRRFSIAHIYNPRKVKSLCMMREQEVEAMVNAISINSTSLVNVNDIGMRLFNNIMFREVFGTCPTTCGDDQDRGMKSQYHELVAEVIFFMGDFSFGDLFPFLAWMDVVRGWKRRLDRSFRALDAVLEEGIVEGMKRRERREAGQSEQDDNCFLDVLLRHLRNDHNGKDDPLGLHLNMVEAKALLMNMFIGGTDTSASIVEWAMTNLMRNPEVMIKAQEEVRRVVGCKTNVKESDLQELHYLKMVIKETLRLHPPAPLLLHRECMKDATIEGYTIPAKTRVLINAWAIGRDPKYWDDPETFRPERFEGSPVSYLGNHFQLIPFGAGRRICPGLGLGIVGVELAMANLLYSFNWDLPAGMSRNDISMEESLGIVTHPKKPLLLVPTTA